MFLTNISVITTSNCQYIIRKGPFWQWIIHVEETQNQDTCWLRGRIWISVVLKEKMFKCVRRCFIANVWRGEKTASAPDWLSVGTTTAACDLCPLQHILICTVEELTRHAVERVIKPLTPGFMMIGGWGLGASFYCSLKVWERQCT